MKNTTAISNLHCKAIGVLFFIPCCRPIWGHYLRPYLLLLAIQTLWTSPLLQLSRWPAISLPFNLHCKAIGVSFIPCCRPIWGHYLRPYLHLLALKTLWTYPLLQLFRWAAISLPFNSHCKSRHLVLFFILYGRPIWGHYIRPYLLLLALQILWTSPLLQLFHWRDPLTHRPTRHGDCRPQRSDLQT